MPNKILAQFTTGYTLYAVIQALDTGYVWNGSAFVSPSAASWATYAVAMTEFSTTGLYRVNFPSAIIQGDYNIMVFARLGASAAPTDQALMSTVAAAWSGTSFSSPDPLTSAVPGAYGVGTVGYALGRVPDGVTVVYPPVSMVSDEELAIVRGDDYYGADGRAINWTDQAGNWPTLTSATIALTFYSGQYDQVVLTASGTIVTATGDNKQVYVELSAANTNKLDSGRVRHKLTATLVSGHVVTLASGITQVVI